MLLGGEQILDLNDIRLIQLDLAQIIGLFRYLLFHVFQDQLLHIGWQVHNIYIIVRLFKILKNLNQLFILLTFVLFFILRNDLTLIPLIFEILKLIIYLTLLALRFLFLLILLLYEIVFTIKLLVKTSSDPWKGERLRDISFLKP